MSISNGIHFVDWNLIWILSVQLTWRSTWSIAFVIVTTCIRTKVLCRFIGASSLASTFPSFTFCYGNRPLVRWAVRYFVLTASDISKKRCEEIDYGFYLTFAVPRHCCHVTKINSRHVSPTTLIL